jgi:hypothetical protein
VLNLKNHVLEVPRYPPAVMLCGHKMVLVSPRET